MKFLGHCLLAGADPGLRIGGLTGDFFKGPLLGHRPAQIAAGVALHRRIDSFADTHPAYRRSRARVGSGRQRFAGVMIDMFYDHFLAAHWGASAMNRWGRLPQRATGCCRKTTIYSPTITTRSRRRWPSAIG